MAKTKPIYDLSGNILKIDGIISKGAVSTPAKVAVAAITALTDNTAGTASDTLASGITDAAAKNAIASLAAKVNALLTALKL